MCFLLLLLLIKWNSQPQKLIIEHSKWHDEVAKEIQIERNIDQVRDLPKPAKEIIDTQSGNVIHVAIYMEAQCPDTSRFIKRQLVPTWQHLKNTGRVEYEIIPFGKARCEKTPEGDDFKCECQHGNDECELNALMNCAIEELGFPDSYIPLIGCIQGSDSLATALEKCVDKGEYKSKASTLKKCGEGRRGRHLLALAGQRTTALNPALNFVPWVMLEGRREHDAFYALEENVCKRLDPKPSECQPILAAAAARG